MDHIVQHGDCIEVMRDMPANSIDSIVTDPPYGLGFMGKKWDALPPGEEWAKECLRVLKPGGHMLSFGGTRTWHRLAVAIENAGFEMRDSIAWMYGSGFPKHRANLKPAFEPIIMARKPFKGALTANEAIHGTGALNIDACRIPTEDVLSIGSNNRTNAAVNFGMKDDVEAQGQHEAGRYPANVVLDQHAAEVLDQQCGTLKSGKMKAGTTRGNTAGWAGPMPDTTGKDTYGDSGGASRFFYVAKAPKKERPVVDGVAHPTVKPLALMRWLCLLVTPQGGTVLDPFAGSGTTAEACALEGLGCIAIESEPEYIPLINSRIERATLKESA